MLSKIRRALSLTLVLCLLIALPAALAAPDIQVVEESFQTYTAYTTAYGLLSAIIQNKGDSPAQIDEGLFQMLDKEGEVLGYTNVYSSLPRELKPGETAFISAKLFLEIEQDAPNPVSDYHFTLSTREAAGFDAYSPLTAEGQLLKLESAYDSRVYAVVTVENAGEQTVYDVEAVANLRDKEGKLQLTLISTGWNVGVLPGGKISLRIDPDEQLLAQWEKQGIVVDRVEAFAFQAVAPE